MIDEGSFRDPNGFVFYNDGKVYRGINEGYRIHYDKLMQSGLYELLTRENLLIKHEEVTLPEERYKRYYKIIKPERILFISYPYEWSFSQFKDAALLTLSIQKKALESGMTLKDANGFNIQFYKGKPILIDTLSFEIYKEHTPWQAYKQFCEHFLGPLMLMASRDVRLGIMMRDFINGIPLDLVVKLLPVTKKLNPSVYMHLVLHSRLQKKFASGKISTAGKGAKFFTIESLKRLVTGLESLIKSLSPAKEKTEWDDYYETGIEHHEYLANKEKIINAYLDLLNPSVCWDLGANDAKFSGLVAERGINVIAFDSDYACIERSYQNIKKQNTENLLPLIMDLTNPTPGLGWCNTERASLFTNSREPDLIMALALIHHLVISSNIPLSKIAKSFSTITKFLIIEFVPKSDSKVKFLLNNREDIFDEYTPEGFRDCFGKFFSIMRENRIEGSERVLYLLQSKS